MHHSIKPAELTVKRSQRCEAVDWLGVLGEAQKVGWGIRFVGKLLSDFPLSFASQQGELT
jgi:hypothetical protein